MSQLRAWATGRLDRLVREGSPTAAGTQPPTDKVAISEVSVS
ncbi:MAG: hypothetical protein QOD82_3685 [Pseudonocardiales bacterium]|nr:hypothetical protein [Pseudonocardiales bacterium]MDT7675783.1 hypothetical protein [Pseudonocardiales bacterium]